MGGQLEIDPETEVILTRWTKFPGPKHLDLFLWISNLERNSKVIIRGREYLGQLLLK